MKKTKNGDVRSSFTLERPNEFYWLMLISQFWTKDIPVPVFSQSQMEFLKVYLSYLSRGFSLSLLITMRLRPASSRPIAIFSTCRYVYIADLRMPHPFTIDIGTLTVAILGASSMVKPEHLVLGSFDLFWIIK